MDAKKNFRSNKARLWSRHATEASDAALHLFDAREIFKKTPCAAGLKLRGRNVAKDMDDVGSIPLLMKTLLDNGHPGGDCMTVTGRTTAENLKSVKSNRAPQGVIVRVAAMLQDGDIIEIDGVAGPLDVKLTGAEPEKHETKWRPRATNQTLGALWKFAQDFAEDQDFAEVVGPEVDGAVIHPCGAHEKQCYADI